MSWRDRLQPASFRGVPFFVQSGSKKPGRRTVIHEFPTREDVEIDDLGRGPDRFEIKAFVAGADYDQARDALEAALVAPGPGTLVYPTRGRLQVVIEGEPQIAEEFIDKSGVAIFTFAVVVFAPNPPAQAPATGHALTSAANAVTNAAAAKFVTTFTTTGLASSFVDSAISRVRDAASALATAREAISGALAIADTVTDSLEDFADDAESLVADPSRLAGEFQPLADDILRAGARAADAASRSALAVRDAGRIAINRRTTRQTLVGSAAMQAVGTSDLPISEATELSAREASNRKELTNLIRASAIASVARAAVSLPFTSRDEAIAASDVLSAEIDDVAEDVDDDTYVALRNMRVALAAHLSRVASTLPEIRTYTVAQDSSVTMIAHWLYGDATRADEIVARNSIKNPGLIPAGTQLEVTSA